MGSWALALQWQHQGDAQPEAGLGWPCGCPPCLKERVLEKWKGVSRCFWSRLETAGGLLGTALWRRCCRAGRELQGAGLGKVASTPLLLLMFNPPALWQSKSGVELTISDHLPLASCHQHHLKAGPYGILNSPPTWALTVLLEAMFSEGPVPH